MLFYTHMYVKSNYIQPYFVIIIYTFLCVSTKFVRRAYIYLANLCTSRNYDRLRSKHAVSSKK